MELFVQAAKELLDYMELPYGTVSVWPWMGNEQNYLIVYYDESVQTMLNGMPTEFKGYIVDYKERVTPVVEN